MDWGYFPMYISLHRGVSMPGTTDGQTLGQFDQCPGLTQLTANKIVAMRSMDLVLYRSNQNGSLVCGFFENTEAQPNVGDDMKVVSKENSSITRHNCLA